MKPFAWSWSALTSYETCPKKHWHTRIRKDVADSEGPGATWGKQVHDALADRIAKGRRLPKEMPYDHHVDEVMQNSDRTVVSTQVEQKLALSDDIKPCEYFDRRVDPWVRVVADVLKIREEAGIARVVDWKTGKGKFYPDPVSGEPVAEDPGQLMLSAAVIMAHYPKIDVVVAQYYWLQEGVPTENIYTRPELAKIWSAFLPRVDRFAEAWHRDDFPAKKNGLCKRHCPVTSCPHNGESGR